MCLRWCIAYVFEYYCVLCVSAGHDNWSARLSIPRRLAYCLWGCKSSHATQVISAVKLALTLSLVTWLWSWCRQSPQFHLRLQSGQFSALHICIFSDHLLLWSLVIHCYVIFICFILHFDCRQQFVHYEYLYTVLLLYNKPIYYICDSICIDTRKIKSYVNDSAHITKLRRYPTLINCSGM